MITERRVSGLLILSTLGGALFLAILPLPDALSAVRPALYPATVLFWVLVQPGRFGLLAAWTSGVLIDVIYGTPLGEHGLALAVAGYLVIRMRELLWSFPVWQQSVLLLPVFILYEFALFWIDGVTGAEVNQWWRWLPVATTVLVWPLWASLLERIAELEVG
ncbi:rod shape-determining protein MreD [uncultured Salinisphaera sp.]|uniref:rod shape-determining protein MreD n=1 Tax=uncultured Salinisphaera sp. TaxID=359372 RepID=UPI0032B2DE5E|tara:strand:+ start:408 stop:893 length:486 start_codon:yes stop_codon:yes gene_type:complete